MRPTDVDLEERLRRLRGGPPPAGVREGVLAAVDEALRTSADPRLDRWLARPTPWVAAAAALLLLLGVRALGEASFRRALGPAASPAGDVPIEAFARRDHAMLALLGRGEEDGR